MNRFAILLMAALLPTIGGRAQDLTPLQPPTDADGWGKVKWGMTIEDARRVTSEFATEPVRPPGPAFVLVDRIILRDVPIGDTTCKVMIQSKRNSDVVDGVSINAGPIAGGTEIRASAFDTLKKLLIEKYSRPKSEERRIEDRNMVTVIMWGLASTSIVLKRAEGPYGNGYVIVEYSPVDKKARDIL